MKGYASPGEQLVIELYVRNLKESAAFYTHTKTKTTVQGLFQLFGLKKVKTWASGSGR